MSLLFVAATVAVIAVCAHSLDVAIYPSMWVNVRDNVRLECLGGDSSSNITWRFRGQIFVVCMKWSSPLPAIPNVQCKQVYQLFLKNITEASEGPYSCEAGVEHSKEEYLKVGHSGMSTAPPNVTTSFAAPTTPSSNLTITANRSNKSNVSLPIISANRNTTNQSTVSVPITSEPSRHFNRTYSSMPTGPVDMSAATNHSSVQPDPTDTVKAVGDNNIVLIIVLTILGLLVLITVVVIIFLVRHARRKRQSQSPNLTFHIENCNNVVAGMGNEQNHCTVLTSADQR